MILPSTLSCINFGINLEMMRLETQEIYDRGLTPGR